MTRGQRRRCRLRVLVCVLLLLGILACCSGTSTVIPPSDVRDPVTVYLFEDALHTGLVLPRANGLHVEYGFGDRDWYALGHDEWYHVFDTVLCPTDGTLARREIDARDRAGIEEWYWSGRVIPLVVERERAERLLRELDVRYRAEEASAIRNADVRTSFVADPESFWFGNNCHDRVAAWLRALDCDVSWAAIRWGLSVERRGQ